MSGPSADAPDRRCLLALAGLVALFFTPALVGGGVFFFGDASNYALRLAYSAEWLRAGRFPLWNPHLSLGAPHAADAVALPFYPPHLLLALLLQARLYGFDAALHHFIAAAGTFGLARHWGLSRAASLLAGTAYSLGGFAFGHLQHLNILVGMAWIPVVLLTTERYLAGRDRRSLGLAMLALGLFVLGGHSQIVLYGLLVLAALCVCRLAALWIHGEGRCLPGLIAGLLALGAAGCGLAAVFLLPFAEWMEFVSRGKLVTAAYATWYSLPPARLAGLVAPLWFGGSPDRPGGAALLVEWSSYVGLLPLALAPVALSRPTGRVLFLAGLALVALVLALGGNTPIYRLVLSVPVFSMVRAPARFLVLSGLALALLAGFGLDALRAGAGRWLARPLSAALLLLAAAVARAAWVGERAAGPLPMRPDQIRFDQADTWVLIAALCATAALLWRLAAGRLSRTSLLLVMLFCAADLFAFQAQIFFNRPFPPDTFRDPSSTADAIRRAGDSPRFYTQTGKELEGRVFDGRDFEGYRRLMWESLRNSLPLRFGLQSLTGYLTEPPVHQKLISAIRQSRALDSRGARLAGTFGVRYVIASPERGVSAPELTLVSSGVRALYRNELAVPRIHLVPDSRLARNERAALALVAGDDFDPRGSVVIEEYVPPIGEGPLGSWRTTIVHDEPDRIVVEMAARRAAWLVFNDTFAPGWKATVDGRPARVLRANGLVRTVLVPAGYHRVEFLYAPAAFFIGLAVSGVALLATVSLVFGGGILGSRLPPIERDAATPGPVPPGTPPLRE